MKIEFAAAPKEYWLPDNIEASVFNEDGTANRVHYISKEHFDFYKRHDAYKVIKNSLNRYTQHPVTEEEVKQGIVIAKLKGVL
jgi:hypothetical protein